MSAWTFGFIGLGLIGGSIARAIREKLPESVIIAYDISEAPLRAALSDGVINAAADAIDGRFGQCDYIFLCAPVQKNDENLRAVAEFLSPDGLLTDVGSVKTGIHEVIHSMGLDDRFIGGHPMAGSERTGYVNSKTILLENAYYILTPTKSVSRERIEAYRDLVQTLGAIPLIMDCERHDYVTAAVSHLPHVIAATLVNLVRDSDSEDGLMKMVAAGGFKDITRIASSSAHMWQQICLTNTSNIAALLDDYIRSLTAVRGELDHLDGSALFELFDGARIYRDGFINASSGPIKRSYTVTIDIADEPGALAAIATILALHQISIKNIGIIHNRESETGVLRIEFYEESSIERSAEILRAKGYTVYTGK
ncbi:MAG: prephenate dehydrogenase [Clostridium sp.]|nr:prephenate dehydrogenase [Acetatifactor muris]MCM1527838.1 prephenate dehydrogenase [Bacteroides sp.]MCM1563338.1 prephenate dehydrogenase [Clostridium sp.]